MIFSNIVDGSSSKYYDLIANRYHEISNLRSLYNKSINLILKKNLKDVDILLDIGTGDGLRIIDIISKLDSQPNSVVCLEPALKLFNIAKSNFKKFRSIDIYNSDLDSFCIETNFSHITALWNVVGHVGEPIKFFKKTFDLLSPGGEFIFDVNNRFNYSQYGLMNVVVNILKELGGSVEKGIFSLNPKLSDDLKVYLSSPFEVEMQLKNIGFKVVDIHYINYKNGQEVNSFLNGQALFVCKRPY